MIAAILLLTAAAATVPADTVRAPGVPAAAAPAPRFAVELRVGGTVGDVEGAYAGREKKPGAAWRLSGSFALAPHAAIYLGYGRAAFRCEGGFCRDGQVSFASAGPDAGLQLQVGPAWLRAGGLFQSLAVQWTDHTGARLRERADAALGVELAAGIAFRVGSRLLLTPGLRFSASSVTFPGEPGADALRHLTADLGLRAPLF